MPAAATYASIRLSVYGRSYGGPGHMALEDYADNDLDVTRSIGSSSTWYAATAVGPTGHVNASRVVTAYVWVTAEDGASMDYQKVRLTYRYAVLK